MNFFCRSPLIWLASKRRRTLFVSLTIAIFTRAAVCGDQPVGTEPSSPVPALDAWAYRTPQPPEGIRVAEGDWARTQLDRLVLATLEANQITPAAPADRRTLIRRAAYDLLGLPPTAEEISSFVADRSPDAFAKVVDRLLSSPAFGVRWGRYWLDNVRYAQDDPTCAANNNGTFDIGPYRDWVVRSFNQDLAYDQFVRMQLAGDLISRSDCEQIDADALTATGLWGLAHLVEGNDKEKVVADFVDEQLDLLGRTFLGLTLSCARCHDHKYDPISQEDYYALAGIFYSSHIFRFRGASARVRDRIQRPLVWTRREQLAFDETKQQLARLDSKIAALRRKYHKPLELMKVREELRATLAQMPTEEEKANVEKRIAELRKRESELSDDQEQNGWESNPVELELIAKIESERKPLEHEIDKVVQRMVIQEGPVPGTRHTQIGGVALLLRGDHLATGRIVPRRFPRVVAQESGQPLTFSGSGRRELARWITRPDHPLTARVMANRIWQHLFGVGIVATPSNFGRLGRRPTNPQLLDCLAVRFIEGDWSVKSLIREIMLSSTYRQASVTATENWSRDPENHWFGRMNRKRLDAEALKDTLLWHSGSVRRSPVPDSGRALFDEASRQKPHQVLALFDGADPHLILPRREDSTSAPQALFMLNHPIVQSTAEVVARRALSDSDSPTIRIRIIYDRLFGRVVSEQELQLASDVLESCRNARQTSVSTGQQVDLEVGPWADLCVALICSNEFLYVD